MSADQTLREALAEALAEVLAEVLRREFWRPENGGQWQRIAKAVLASDWLASHDAALIEAGKEALADALHPEFGTEWREPDGIIWKAAQQARAEGKAEADAAWVAKVEALADEIDRHDYTPECMDDGHRCGECVTAEAIRALIPAEAATTLAARDAKVRRDALNEAEVRWMKVAVMKDGEAIREAQADAYDKGVAAGQEWGRRVNAPYPRNPYRDIARQDQP